MYKLTSGLIAALALTGCNELKMQNSNIDNPVFGGETTQQVIAKYGQPVDVQVNGNNTVLTFCKEVLIYNNLLHLWMVDGKVSQTRKTSNDEIGTCLDNSTQVDWVLTKTTGQLTFVRRGNSGVSKAIAESLQQSQQQNNQIYNSLIENMGQQQQSLQPQRFQTNCMMIGNMMSCN